MSSPAAPRNNPSRRSERMLLAVGIVTVVAQFVLGIFYPVEMLVGLTAALLSMGLLAVWFWALIRNCARHNNVTPTREVRRSMWRLSGWLGVFGQLAGFLITAAVLLTFPEIFELVPEWVTLVASPTVIILVSGILYTLMHVMPMPGWLERKLAGGDA